MTTIARNVVILDERRSARLEALSVRTGVSAARLVDRALDAEFGVFEATHDELLDRAPRATATKTKARKAAPPKRKRARPRTAGMTDPVEVRRIQFSALAAGPDEKSPTPATLLPTVHATPAAVAFDPPDAATQQESLRLAEVAPDGASSAPDGASSPSTSGDDSPGPPRRRHGDPPAATASASGTPAPVDEPSTAQKAPPPRLAADERRDEEPARRNAPDGTTPQRRRHRRADGAQPVQALPRHRPREASPRAPGGRASHDRAAIVRRSSRDRLERPARRCALHAGARNDRRGRARTWGA
jgi:hypothetical protein